MRTDRGALGPRKYALTLLQGSAKFSFAVRTRWVGVWDLPMGYGDF